MADVVSDTCEVRSYRLAGYLKSRGGSIYVYDTFTVAISTLEVKKSRSTLK